MKRDNAYDSTRLVEVASISAGYPFRGKIEKLPDGEFAVIQMRNASPETGIDWGALTRVELPRVSEKALLQPGDIILSTRGGIHSSCRIYENANWFSIIKGISY